MSDQVYVESMGTTCYVNGERGVAIEVHTIRHRIEGVFVSLDERPVVLYVKVGSPTGERGAWREVISSDEVDRDEFDRIVGLDVLRSELGWKPRDSASEEECGAKAWEVPGADPCRRTWIPCQKSAGHEGEHYSTTGCAGGQVKW